MMNNENQVFIKEEYVAPLSEIVLFDNNEEVMDVGGSTTDPFEKLLGGLDLNW